MKSNILKFALAASLVLNVSVFATAGYRHYQQSKMWVSPFGKVMEKDHFMFEELSLKPEQLAAMKSKAIAFRAEIDIRRQEIDSKRQELIALMRYERPDKKAIGTTIKEISGKQEEMQTMIAGHMLEFKAMLDKGQQQKFLDLIEKNMVRSGQMTCQPSQPRM